MLFLINLNARLSKSRATFLTCTARQFRGHISNPRENAVLDTCIFENDSLAEINLESSARKYYANSPNLDPPEIE